MNKPTVYLETTVPSYLVAEPSHDVVVAGHQRTTHEWWQTASDPFELMISESVHKELSAGDPELAKRRLALVQGLSLLVSSKEVEDLSNTYACELGLVGRALNDLPHIAFSVFYKVDFLVTWNCAHLANAMVERKLREINARLRLWMPAICTPEELMADPQEKTL
jgi:hypothetical protein